MNNPLKQVAQKQAKAYSAENKDNLKKITRAKKEPDDRLWNFSFRYWNQLKFFGLDGRGIDNNWLVSVLERLKQLSGDTIERVYRDAGTRETLRFHLINWQNKNIPIKQADIPGLPSHCIDNPEFALHQFQISTAKGRVVGFFDENWVFNIVLLDPLHNLQPSKHFDYQVNPCSPLSCEITSLREGIKQGISDCKVDGCQAVQRVKNLVHQQEHYAEEFQILMVKITDQSQLDWAKDLVAKGQVDSLAAIFEMGLLAVVEGQTVVAEGK